MDIGQVANINRDRMMRAQAIARSLYGQWSVAAGRSIPWEHLSNQEREAWMLLITDADFRCLKHDYPLVCVHCQREVE